MPFNVEYAISTGTINSNEAAVTLLDGPVSTTTVNVINTGEVVPGATDPLPISGDGFAVRYKGVVEITEPGTWNFMHDADDGFVLFIDGQIVAQRFEGTGINPDWATFSTAELTAGSHNIEVLFWDNAGGENVYLMAQPPSGFPFEVIGDTANGGLAVTAGTFADGVLVTDQSADEDGNQAVAFSHGDEFLNATDASGNQTLTVSGIDADQASVVVTVSDGTNTETATLGAIAGGIATATLTAAQLANFGNGTLTATVTVTDGAGNTAPAIDTITLDTTAPVTPGIPDLLAASDSGSSQTDDLTNDTTPTFAVNVSGLVAGDTVELVDTFGPATVVATYTVTGEEIGGIAEITTSALSSDTHTIGARSVDAAGNFSALSDTLSILVDTQNPTTPGTPDLVSASDSGSSQTDDVTNDATPTFEVSIANMNLTDTVQLIDTSNGNAVVGSVVLELGVGSTVLIEATGLSAGTHTIAARGVDVAGNISALSTALEVTIDTMPPSALGTPDLLAASDSGTSDTDNLTNDTTPTFAVNVSGLAVGDTVELMETESPQNVVATYTVTGTETDAIAEITTSALGDGVHSIGARAIDVAGNPGPLSAGLLVTIDTEAPAAQTQSVPLAEIPDQDAATTGTLITLASLSGADGTTYALNGTGGVYDAVEIASDGVTLQIIDTEAARGFFDFEENPTITIDVIGTDSAGNTTPSTITVNLSDLNDAPELGGGLNEVTGKVMERDDNVAGENTPPLGTSGSFTVHDDDVANSHSVTVNNISSTNGSFLGFFQAGFSDPIQGDGDGTVGWSFTIGAPLPAGTQTTQMAIIDALAAGESIVQEYDVTVTETGGGESFVQRVTVTIEGTNDAPVISGAAVAAELTEVVDDGTSDQSLSASGTLNVVDTDTNDTVTVGVTSVIVAASGSFEGTNPLNESNLLEMMQVVAGDGTGGTPGTDTGALAADQTAGSDFTWQFSAGRTESSPFDFLPEGQTLVLEYTLTATDSSSATVDKTDTQVVTITITGSNDVPTIAAVSTAPAVLEAGGVENDVAGTGEVTGTLNADGENWADADDGEAANLAVVSGSHGADAQAELTFDGGTGSEAEIDGTYGMLFVSADGSYRYVLDDTRAATQALNAGEAASETFNYTIANGADADDTATSTLTVNITGANDTPEITFVEGQNLGSVEEQGVDGSNAAINTPPTTANGTLSADDVDAEDGTSGTALTWGVEAGDGQVVEMGVILGTYGSFAVDASGTWTFTLDNTAEAVQALHDSESVSETFTVTVTDSRNAVTTQDVTITINGTNDAPVIAVDGNAVADNAVVEAGEGVVGDNAASGAFISSDVDTGGADAVIWSITAVNGGAITHSVANGAAAEAEGTYGSLTLNNDGTWSYLLDDADADTQALAAGASVTDVFTVRVADGLGGYSELDVTVNVTGTNDAPVITVETGDSQAESVQESDAENLTTTGTLTLSDVDADDSVSLTVTGVSASGTLGDFDANDLALQTMLSITAGSPLATGAGNASGQATWTFDSGTETFDYLGAGESITLEYTVTADDGDATDTETVTVTVNGTNDRPEIVVEGTDSATGSLTESTDLMGGNLETSGTLSIADADASDAHTVSATRASITWTDENGADNGGAPSSVTPLPAGLEAALDEAFSATINGTDARQVDWTFTLADTLADFLGAGETLTVVYDVTVNDGEGFDGTGADENSVSAVQQVTITITGTNDAPTVTADARNDFTEGDALEIDANSVLVGPNVAETVTVNLLGEGTDTTDEIWVTNVTELDTNDVRTITGTTSVSASGNIPAGFAASDAEAAFTLGAPGAESVTFDRNAAVFDALDDGQFIDVALTYTVTTTSPDGTTTTTDTVTTTIRVNGANDAPYIIEGADFAAEVTELTAADAGHNAPRDTVTGSITFNDVDPGDIANLQVITQAVQGAGAGAAPLSAYVGTFSAGFLAPTGTDVANAGSVFYNFNLNDTVLDNLAEGETFTQEYQVSISDGTATTSRNIVLTFTGTNDAPVITGTTGATTLTEDAGTVETGSVDSQSLTGTITFDDVDISDMAALAGSGTADTHTVTAEVTGVARGGDAVAEYAGPTGTLTFDVASAGLANDTSTVGNTANWIYAITDGDFDFLAAGETLEITYTVTVADQNGGTGTQDITFTITGTNDAATIAGVATGAVTEDGDGETTFQTVSDALTITDADDGQAVFTPVVAGTPGGNAYGTFAMDANGNWTYTLDNDVAAVQALGVGESLTDTITVSSVDGTDTQLIEVTINGTNDAPVLDASGGMDTAFGSTGEDSVSATGTLTLSDVDLSNTVGVAVTSVAVFEGSDNGVDCH